MLPKGIRLTIPHQAVEMMHAGNGDVDGYQNADRAVRAQALTLVDGEQIPPGCDIPSIDTLPSRRQSICRCCQKSLWPLPSCYHSCAPVIFPLHILQLLSCQPRAKHHITVLLC